MKNILLTLLICTSALFGQTRTVSPNGGGLNSADNPAFLQALGATTTGSSFLTLPNPSSIRFPRVNADNTVSLLSDSDFITAIGAMNSVSFVALSDTPATYSGQAGKTLVVNAGATALEFADAAAGGLTNFTESVNTAPPNATTPVVGFLAANAATNVDVALTPKGSGAIVAQVPDNSFGGNKRGSSAVDLQMARTNEMQVASGTRAAILAGQENTASGANSGIIAGTVNTASGFGSFISASYGSTASGNYSVCMGGALSTASGVISLAFGSHASTKGIYGRIAHASGTFSSTGQAQKNSLIIRRETSDATPQALTSNNSSLDMTNNLLLENNSCHRFRAMVVGRTSAGVCYTAEITGAIKRGANAAATEIIGSVTNDVIADAGAAAWNATAIANTTFGSLEIQVTGEAATTIHWVASVETVEVVY